MLKKVWLLLLALVLVAGLAPALLAVPSTPTESTDGMKADRPGDDPESAVPASSEWGMLIMIVLVLSSSTAMLGGGGFFQRRLRFQFVTPEPEHETPREKDRPRVGKASPKNKSKRAFSYHRDQEWQRKGKNFTRRNAITRRKSGGPGCRGVR
jgi:hypothetical protein